MIMKHLDLKWQKIIKLEKNKSMNVVFNYIVFLWVCSYLSLKISAIWLADEKVLNQLVLFQDKSVLHMRIWNQISILPKFWIS